MYVSIHCEAKSAALDRTHHLLGMQEGTSGGSCRRVRAGRQRADGAAPKRQGTKVATNRPFKFGSAPGVRVATGWPWASESSESPPPGPLDRPWASPRVGQPVQLFAGARIWLKQKAHCVRRRRLPPYRPRRPGLASPLGV